MNEKHLLSLNINHREVSAEVEAGQTLADLLRETLDLTGTKIGCDEDECGICTVLIDGEPILSCMYPAVRAQGKNILTIEGLSEPDQLHPLQEAFIQYGGLRTPRAQARSNQ
jgi:carbon-monoxide dehydrogenase small subunit